MRTWQILYTASQLGSAKYDGWAHFHRETVYPDVIGNCGREGAGQICQFQLRWENMIVEAGSVLIWPHTPARFSN